MTREKTLFLIAILMIVIPHLGLTNLMEQVTFFILGLIVIIFAYGIYFENKIKQVKSSPSSAKKSSSHRDTTFRPIARHEETNSFKIIQKDNSKTEEDNFHI